MRKRFPRGGGLFPLDRRGGLVRHVVHDPVDSPDLVRDSDRDAVEDLMGDVRVRRGHAVDRVDRGNRDRLTVHTEVPVNADGLHRQEDGEVLPREEHETAAGRGLDLLLDDGGRASDEGDSLRRHFSDHPNRESRPGKRLSLRDPHAEFLQGLRDVLGLSLPHEPGVDVDREKAISEGATREDRRRRAVDPTRTGDDRLARHGLADGLGLFGDESGRVEHHSPSVRESSSTHFFNASRCSLSLSTRRSSRNAKISTARIAAFSPRSRPTAATGTPGGICETLRTASRFSLPLTGTPITGFVVWAAIVPGSPAERPAIAMKTFAVVFRIRSRRRSGVRWADPTTTSYPTPN